MLLASQAFLPKVTQDPRHCLDPEGYHHHHLLLPTEEALAAGLRETMTGGEHRGEDERDSCGRKYLVSKLVHTESVPNMGIKCRYSNSKIVLNFPSPSLSIVTSRK